MRRPTRDLDFARSSRCATAAATRILEFPGAYTSYLQPLLLDTSFKAMQTAGRIAGRSRSNRVRRSDGPRAARPDLDDGERNCRDRGTAGKRAWQWRRASGGRRGRGRRDGPRLMSRNLRWRDGALFGLALGASELRFATRGPAVPAAASPRAFRCSTAPSIWRAFASAMPARRRSRSSSMRPSSRSACAQLCKAFGWPEFGGQRRRRDLEAAHARRRRHARHDAAGAGVRRRGDDQRPAAGAAFRAMAAPVFQHRARQSRPRAA